MSVTSYFSDDVTVTSYKNYVTITALATYIRRELKALIKRERKSSQVLRSNSSIVLEVPRGKMLRSFGDRSFSMAAPKLWNELPLAMRDIPNT